MSKVKTTNAMLKQIAQFFTPMYDLNGQDTGPRYQERRHLWAVLTALRGPDADLVVERLDTDGKPNTFTIASYQEMKRATTCVIRYFLLGPDSSVSSYADVSYDTQEWMEVRRRMNVVEYHFVCHAKAAFDALGLQWDAVNEPQTLLQPKKGQIK